MRLHSRYFSMQNLETTVDQGAAEMLFKGVLLCFTFMKNNPTTDYMQRFTKVSNVRLRMAELLSRIHSGHCKVASAIRKSGVRESHYTSLIMERVPSAVQRYYPLKYIYLGE